MIRKLVLSSIALVALTFGSMSVAEAQGTTPTAEPSPTAIPCNVENYNNCIAYPTGGFGTAAPTATPSAAPAPTSSAVVSADTVDATATAGGGNAIAFTGVESRVLGYAGLGLIGFGAVALIAARRRSESDLD